MALSTYLGKKSSVLSGDVAVVNGQNVRLDEISVRSLCHRRLGHVPRRNDYRDEVVGRCRRTRKGVTYRTRHAGEERARPPFVAVLFRFHRKPRLRSVLVRDL